MDEIKIYNRSLTSSEISILHLNGSVQFDSSSNRQPPVVELYQAQPESNVSARIYGELTNIDEENPVVTIYYGLADGGLSIDGWDSNLTLNEGSPFLQVHLRQVFPTLFLEKDIFSGLLLKVRTVQTGQRESQKSKKT